jgi:hypothetical protein
MINSKWQSANNADSDAWPNPEPRLQYPVFSHTRTTIFPLAWFDSIS